MTEDERRLQISLRMKAARYLAGSRGEKGGATALPNKEVAQRGPLLNEKVSANKLEEVEQMRATLRGSEMDAYIAALRLPADWFDGLYPADRGNVSTELGAGLRAIAEAVQELRQAREATLRKSAGADHPPAAPGGDAG